MRLPKLAMPLLALVIFFGVIGIAYLSGWWVTTKDITTVTSPEEIKGWMTFQQVSERFNMPVEVIYEKLGIPADTPPDTPLRTLESMAEGLDVDAVRAVVAEYQNAPAGDSQEKK